MNGFDLLSNFLLDIHTSLGLSKDSFLTFPSVTLLLLLSPLGNIFLLTPILLYEL